MGMKTAKQHVKDALASGDKKKIQAYMKKYFSLKKRDDIVDTARKIFE